MKRRITESSANKNANPEINLTNKSIVQVNDEQPKQRTVISVSSSNNRRNRFKTLNSTNSNQHETTNAILEPTSCSIQLSTIDTPSSSISSSLSSSSAVDATSGTQKTNKLKPNNNIDGSVDKINVNVNSSGGSGEFINNSLVSTPHQLTPSNLDSKSRTSCYFGIKCLSYNFNPEHRSIFAHPGDLDYKRPYFPPAPPGSPACPYGAECYRKNLDHFTQLSHPTTNTLKRNYHKSSTISSSSTTSKQLNLNTSIRLTDNNHHYNNGDKLLSIDDATEIKRRKKVLVFTTEVQQDDNDDEDEDGDLFLNDINSDEYDSEEEDDCDGGDDVDSGGGGGGCDLGSEPNNFTINNYYKL